MRTTVYLGGAAAVLFLVGTAPALADACMKITLTGVQGGPPVFNGQAGAGTLVTYGDETNDCRDVRLQFDTGRGTTQRLSQAKVPVGTIDAIFLTHLHSDHVDDFANMMQLRWHFLSEGPKVDLVCSDDATSPFGHVMSCTKLAAHIGDAFIQSGEIAQRRQENNKRLEGGPADLINVMTFAPEEEAKEVWSSGDVKVSAIRSTHVPGHASYRVDTPAGSVVIGGDAGNDTREPPRETSTSAQVERLAEGADVVVHSTIHPIMGPDGGTGFRPPIFYRQSSATDLGALAQRAGVDHLMLTHLIPPVGTPQHGPFKLPDGALSKQDYEAAVREGGFEGNVIVGEDLATLTLPAN